MCVLNSEDREWLTSNQHDVGKGWLNLLSFRTATKTHLNPMIREYWEGDHLLSGGGITDFARGWKHFFWFPFALWESGIIYFFYYCGYCLFNLLFNFHSSTILFFFFRLLRLFKDSINDFNCSPIDPTLVSLKIEFELETIL